MKRPSWDEYFMKIAMLVSERSTCARRKVGAVIVKDKRILTTGYNGAVKGAKDCLDLGCLRDELKVLSGKDKHVCRALHAEQNSLIQAASHGINVEGATIYCTHNNCPTCARMLVNAGINRVVTISERKEAEFEKIFKEAGIVFEKIETPGTEIMFNDYYGSEWIEWQKKNKQ